GSGVGEERLAGISGKWTGEQSGRNERCKSGFFFSSRRRHTRFKCDWSSDVCSSDLFGRSTLEAFWPGTVTEQADKAWADAELPRSEERRVGKECRSRWTPFP